MITFSLVHADFTLSFTYEIKKKRKGICIYSEKNAKYFPKRRIRAHKKKAYLALISERKQQKH